MRDAKTSELIALTQATSFVFRDLPPNSERIVRVVPLNRWRGEGVPSPDVPCQPHRIEIVRAEPEAESCHLQPPMSVGDDADASGGKFVHIPYRKSGKGTLTYTWTTPADGEFVVTARTSSYWKGAQNFKASLDGGDPLFLSGMPRCWQWWPLTPAPTEPGHKPPGQPIRLKAGKHTLTLTGDEDGLLLDRLLITNDLTWRAEPDPARPVRLVDVQTMPRPGREALILPGKSASFTFVLRNRETQPIPCSVKAERMPLGLNLAPGEAAVDLKPGEGRMLKFDVTASDPRARGHFHFAIQTAEAKQRTVIPVRALETPITLLQVEAENAASLPQGTRVVESSEASGGRYVEFTEGAVDLEFDLPKEADYCLWVRQFSPPQGFGYSGSAAGENFRIVGEWLDVLGRWFWLTSPQAPRHHWKAGKLRLSLTRRGELFRRLDAAIVTDAPEFEPGW